MEFVDIEGYEGLYKINRNGDIWSCRNGRFLKPALARGYKMIGLHKDGKQKSYLIHRLIMLHFVPNPDNLRCIDHINRNRQDNRIENLRWSSHRDNSINREDVEKRKGHIQTRLYTRKDGNISTYYQLRYHLQGEYGIQNIKGKTFKTREEAEEFRNQIYGL